MRKQQGMTLIGMLLSVIAVVFGGIIVIRIVPVYLQHYSIIQSITSLNSIPVSSLSGDADMDVRVLQTSLFKRLDMNRVEHFNENKLVISNEGERKFIVKLKYQIIKHLIFNVSLLFDFDNTKEVIAGSED